MNRRLALWVGMAALACVGGAQDNKTGQPEKTITFDGPAATVDKVIEQLNERAGLSLLVDSRVARQVLLIHVKDVPVPDLLAKIAKATGCEWTTQDGRSTLTWTSENERTQRKAEIAERSLQLQKALEPYVRALASTSKDSSAGLDANNQSVSVAVSSSGGAPIVQTFSPSSSGPGSRAVTRLIQSIGLDTLATLPQDWRVVFATSPTRMQRALPFGAGQIIEAMVAEMRASRAAPATETAGDLKVQYVVGGPPGNLDLRPAKAILVVTRMGLGDGLNFQLIVGAADGQTVTRASLMLIPSPVTPSADVQLKDGGMPIELAALALEYAKMTVGSSPGVGGQIKIATMAMAGSDGSVFVMTSPMGSEKTPALSKEWKDRVTKPETFEPLAWVAGESLGALGKVASLNVVACLPDSAFRPASNTMASGKVSANTLLTATQKEWGLQAFRDGAWLVLTPRKAATAFDSRLSRPILGAALRLLSSKGLLTLDQRADYAANQPLLASVAGMEDACFRLVNAPYASELSATTFSGERKMLRFYHTLGMLQRQSLGAGKSMPISSFSLAQREMLSDMVFNSTDGPSFNRGGVPRALMMPALMGGDLTSERTELLPSGVPQTGALTVTTSIQPAIFGVTDTGERVLVNPMALAMARSGQGGPFGAQANYATFVAGQQSQYTFLFQLTPAASLRRQLSDVRPDSFSQPVPYDRLPADFRARVEQMGAQMQRAMMRAPVAGGGGRINP